ncbi:hypothetical protein V8F06_011115 [Rhypophila decipiens]
MTINWKPRTLPSIEVKKKWKSFKSRTCPTLTIPLVATKIIIVALGTVYNALTTYMSTGYSTGDVGVGFFLRIPLTVLYIPLSAMLIRLIGNSVEKGGRRRVCGLWVGRKQLKIYLHLCAAIQLVGVIIMAALISNDHSYDPCPEKDHGWRGSSFVNGGGQGWQECKRTPYNSFPWLTTIGPGGVMMILVTWIARSEAEELDDDPDHDMADLPAYSLVGEPVPGSEMPLGSPLSSHA